MAFCFIQMLFFSDLSIRFANVVTCLRRNCDYGCSVIYMLRLFPFAGCLLVRTSGLLYFKHKIFGLAVNCWVVGNRIPTSLNGAFVGREQVASLSSVSSSEGSVHGPG